MSKKNKDYEETENEAVEAILFSWLQIYMIANARPTDSSAQRTYQFYNKMLQEKQQIEQIKLNDQTNDEYIISYVQNGQQRTATFSHVSTKLAVSELTNGTVILK